MESETKPVPQVVSVCGGVLKNPENYPNATYQGKRVYFCTKACLRAFEAAPDRFMAGEVEHPLEED